MADLIREDLILPHIEATNDRDVIRELGAFLSRRHEQVSEEEAVDALARRESLGSTALDDGLAIPHAKLANAPGLIACLGRSRKGIDFGAPDGKSTHFFFVLIAPEGAQGSHLRALARICRVFKDPAFRTRLMAARSAHDMFQVLVAGDAD